MTECYSMVRGSVIRITHLDHRGRVGEPFYFSTTKAVAKVIVEETAEAPGNEILSTPDDERRLHLARPAQTIRHRVNIELLKVDPGALSIMTGVPLVYGPEGALGFGEFPFGEGPFGGGIPASPDGKIIGFGDGVRAPLASFALEVWSQLAGQRCADGTPAWGYTLFPHLRGGRVSGFRFTNGLVSFNVVGAQTRRLPGWGVGPHDVDGDFLRLLTPVSRNSSYRQFVSTGQPPEAVVGVQVGSDVVDNGTPSNPMPDPSAPLVLDGGTPSSSGPYIISGGRP